MWIRWRGRDATVDEKDFEALVRAGLVPRDAWIVSPTYTRGHAVEANELETYHLWAPDPDEPPPPPPRTSVLTTIYGSKTPGVTVVMLGANLLVALLLLLRWREGYPYLLRQWTVAQKARVDAWWDVPDLMPMVFMHADLAHLFGNLLYLFAFGAIVEYCLGWWRTLIVYLGAGLTGSIVSYLLLQYPGVSVGASGAIFGLIGATAAYLLRHQREFHARLRWRARRVFIPLTLAVAAYSFTSGNFFAHGGGFLGGAVLAAIFDRALPAEPPSTLPAVSAPFREST